MSPDAHILNTCCLDPGAGRGDGSRIQFWCETTGDYVDRGVLVSAQHVPAWMSSSYADVLEATQTTDGLRIDALGDVEWFEKLVYIKDDLNPERAKERIWPNAKFHPQISAFMQADLALKSEACDGSSCFGLVHIYCWMPGKTPVREEGRFFAFVGKMLQPPRKSGARCQEIDTLKVMKISENDFAASFAQCMKTIGKKTKGCTPHFPSKKAARLRYRMLAAVRNPSGPRI